MSSIATSNQNRSNVTTLPSTPKPQTSKEVIAANVQLLIEQLEAGHSEALTAYLTAMGRFHNYSLGNILEIARQMPEATRVAGFHAWMQLGRNVKKGQKGIRILAPMIGSRKKKDTDATADDTATQNPVLVGFRAAYVFDISQTEGTDLPQFTERTRGEVGSYRERLIDFTVGQGIELEFTECIVPALGMSYGGKIAILPDRHQPKSSAPLCTNSRTRCYTRRNAAPQPPGPYGKPKQKPLPLWSRRPSALMPAEHQPTTSTCTRATPHC
jgi:hypothetical protein